jgi:hypothetical protein
LTQIILILCRDYGDGVVEMSCTFETFDVEILKTPLPYKYVIYSPKVKKPEENYEYLHAHSSWRSVDLNRCLVIPAEHRQYTTGITITEDYAKGNRLGSPNTSPKPKNPSLPKINNSKL